MASALRFLPSVLRFIPSLSPFQCGFEGSAFLTSFSGGRKKKKRERATEMTLFTALLLAFQCPLRHPTIIGAGGWRAAAAVTGLGVAGPHPVPSRGWAGRMRGDRGGCRQPLLPLLGKGTARLGGLKQHIPASLVLLLGWGWGMIPWHTRVQTQRAFPGDLIPRDLILRDLIPRELTPWRLHSIESSSLETPSSEPSSLETTSLEISFPEISSLETSFHRDLMP